MKIILLIFLPWSTLLTNVAAQTLFSCGSMKVSREEFLKAFHKNKPAGDSSDIPIREYLAMYTVFKMKVYEAYEMKLDTIAHLQHDLMNFRSRLEMDYLPGMQEMFDKTGFKKNTIVKEEMLLLYADSVVYSTDKTKYLTAQDVIFSLGKEHTRASDWYAYAKNYKHTKHPDKGETNSELYAKFIQEKVVDYFRRHLEAYSPDFKYEIQEFKEGSMVFELTGRKLNQSSNDLGALRAYYDVHKDHFLWDASANAILIQSKSYAYADYALSNIQKGADWRSICANSEGMTQGDSSRYELSQLPIPANTDLTEGMTTAIERNAFDEGASFVKLIKLYPAKLQRSFEEAKPMVINEYRRLLEEKWLKELAAKYPVVINQAVLQSLPQ